MRRSEERYTEEQSKVKLQVNKTDFTVTGSCDVIEKRDIQYISQRNSPHSGLHGRHRYSSMLAIRDIRPLRLPESGMSLDQAPGVTGAFPLTPPVTLANAWPALRRPEVVGELGTYSDYIERQEGSRQGEQMLEL